MLISGGIDFIAGQGEVGMAEPVLSYDDFYKNLDGMTALATAAATPLRRQKEEKDTAFVKRIVATYLALAAKNGAHA
jgi:hypothetical protein